MAINVPFCSCYVALNEQLTTMIGELSPRNGQLSEPKPPVFAEILQKSHFFLQILACVKNKPYLCSDFTKQAILLLLNLPQILAFVG